MMSSYFPDMQTNWATKTQINSKRFILWFVQIARIVREHYLRPSQQIEDAGQFERPCHRQDERRDPRRATAFAQLDQHWEREPHVNHLVLEEAAPYGKKQRARLQLQPDDAEIEHNPGADACETGNGWQVVVVVRAENVVGVVVACDCLLLRCWIIWHAACGGCGRVEEEARQPHHRRIEEDQVGHENLIWTTLNEKDNNKIVLSKIYKCRKIFWTKQWCAWRACSRRYPPRDSNKRTNLGSIILALFYLCFYQKDSISVIFHESVHEIRLTRSPWYSCDRQ